MSSNVNISILGLTMDPMKSPSQHVNAGMSNALADWLAQSRSNSSLLPVVAISRGGCLISRDLLGRFVVRHRNQPAEGWIAANLPTAHGLCHQLCVKYGTSWAKL
jgi:hypothetical protein